MKRNRKKLIQLDEQRSVALDESYNDEMHVPSSCIVITNASSVIVLFPPNPLSGKLTKVKE